MRMRWFLVMTTILAAAAGLTVLVSQRLDAGGGSTDQIVAGPGGTPEAGATSSTSTPPVGGRVTVTGVVTAVHLDGAVLEPRTVATPFTLVSERGFGNGGELAGVAVEGTDASVVWDGGRPFVLSSGGAMILDPVTLDLTSDGLRLALGGAVQGFTPGTYHLDTPVAVGTRGVAGGRDSVIFDADDQSSFSARGDTALLLAPPFPRHLLGPGSVHLEGTLELVDAVGRRSVTTLDAALGAFDITLAPIPEGGWSIRATLQGTTVAT